MASLSPVERSNPDADEAGEGSPRIEILLASGQDAMREYLKEMDINQ